MNTSHERHRANEHYDFIVFLTGRPRLTRKWRGLASGQNVTTVTVSYTGDNSPGPSRSSQVMGSRSPLPLRTTVQTVVELAKGIAAAESKR